MFVIAQKILNGLCNSKTKDLKGEQNFDVVVLGSGMSSLATASILSKNGLKVAVLEKSYSVGGCVNQFSRPVGDVSIPHDVGLHYLGNAIFPLNLFDSVTSPDIKITYSSLDQVCTRLGVDGKMYDVVNGLDEWVKLLNTQFPSETKAISIFHETFAKDVSQRADNVKKFVDGITKNEALKIVLLHIGENIDDVNVVPLCEYQNILNWAKNGMYFPSGGSQRIVDSICDSITKKCNGKIFTKTTATKLLLDEDKKKVIGVIGKRETEDGKSEEVKFNAPLVVSGIGLTPVFSENANFIDKDLLVKYKIPQEMKKIKYTYTSMMIWFRFKKSSEEMGFPKSGYYLHGFPSKNYFKNCTEYKNQSKPFEKFGKNEVPWVFFTSISSRNPLFPKGYSDITAMIPVEYKWFKKWENTKIGNRGKDYEDLKAEYVDIAKEYVKKVFPNAFKSLDGKAIIGSPLTIKYFLNHEKGSWYGVSKANVENNKFWQQQTLPFFDGLYFCGEDIFGGGVQSALFSGLRVAQIIQEKSKHSNKKK